MIGTTISHYKVLEKIGEGGMGEVYRAEDTNLSREVAIKVLPEQFTQDPQRLARFEREAKLLAQLNHPNIAAIHSFEHSDEIHFLVLELVPGETLSERVAKGPLPVEEALEVCRQIAEGVEAAHEKGVIHRDLKPANWWTPSGWASASRSCQPGFRRRPTSCWSSSGSSTSARGGTMASGASARAPTG